MSAAPSASIAEAYSLLKASHQIHITKELTPVQNRPGAFEFEWTVATPQPNASGLPAVVHLRTIIPVEFPDKETSFYPVEPEAHGFPHQRAVSGRMCLSRDRTSAHDAHRLGIDIRSASEWIMDAANGNLAKPGDRYELPDFSRQAGVSIPSVANRHFLFVEDEDTFHLWRDQIGQSGKLKYALVEHPRAGVVLEFSTTTGQQICQTDWPGVGDCEKIARTGRWILLDSLCFTRHRPSQTYEELDAVCQRQAGIDFYEEMYQAWRQADEGETATILMGFPIPRRYGEPVVEICWQPLFFPGKAADRCKYPGHAKRLTGGLFWNWLRSQVYKPTNAVPWGKSVNVSAERLYARGARAAVLREAGVALFGCGSVGSIVAETLARGGLPKLDLFDPDTFEPGNVCRHTLDGDAFDLSKSVALAKRLGGANPLSTISGHIVGVPLLSADEGESANLYSRAWRALHQSGLWLDCTGDNDALHWLSWQARKNCVPLATVFLTFRAEHLILCLSGKQVDCDKVQSLLVAEIKTGHTPLPTGMFDPPPVAEEVVEGTGCWHPTFPALNSHINALVSSAVDVLEGLLQRKQGYDGHAVVLRRVLPVLDFSGSFQPTPLIEVSWASAYR